MSEPSELNRGEDKSPDADQSSIDWLEQLADEPDAIWGTAPAQPASEKQPNAQEHKREAKVPEQPNEGNVAQQAGASERAQAATHLEPTVESRKASREQVRSLVRALESDDEIVVASDQVEEEVDDQVRRESTPRARYTSEIGVADKVENSSGERRTEGSSGQEENGLVDFSDELTLETDDLMWFDDTEKMPEMKENPHEDDERMPARESDNAASGDTRSEGLGTGDLAASLEANLDQVPDDPDEAIAWLERLAAKQGAPVEELPTVQSVSPNVDLEPDLSLGRFSLSEMDAGEIPEDPDEAMAWLEMLAAKEVASFGEEASQQASGESKREAQVDAEAMPEGEMTAEALSADLDEALEGSLPNGLGEALDWLEELAVEPSEATAETLPAEPLAVVEEPPTPAVAHDVDEALAGAELLFAEPETGESTEDTTKPVDELQYDEAEDAMAWLEQLAVRQGAPIEELTTVDGEVKDLAQEDEEEQVIVRDAPQTADVVPAETPRFSEEATVDEHLELEDEQTSDATADETMVSSDDLVGDMALEDDETLSVTIVEPSVPERDIAEQDMESEAAATQDEMEIATEPEAPVEDLAWLDTLGAVDAEKWLEAEAADQDEDIISTTTPAGDEGQGEEDKALHEEIQTLFGTFPKGPESEALAEARREMEEGNFDESLNKYAALVEEGQFLAFLIADLEMISEQRGPEPGLQRVLGDAYARNGQLRKALESYREALANL